MHSELAANRADGALNFQESLDHVANAHMAFDHAVSLKAHAEVCVAPHVPADQHHEETEVIQMVMHDEPPESIHEHEARLIVAVQEADFVERLMETNVYVDSNSNECIDPKDKLFFI